MGEDIDDKKNPAGGNGEIGISLPKVDDRIGDVDSGHQSILDRVLSTLKKPVFIPRLVIDNGCIDEVNNDEVNNDEKVSLPSMILDNLDDDNNAISCPKLGSNTGDDKHGASPSDPSSTTDNDNNGVSLPDFTSNTADTDNNGVSLPGSTSNADADSKGASLSSDRNGNSHNGVSILGLSHNNGTEVNKGDDQSDDENYADDEDDGEDDGEDNRSFTCPPRILTNHQLTSTVHLPLRSSKSELFVLGSPSSGSDLSSPCSPISAERRVSALSKILHETPCSSTDSPVLGRSFSRQRSEYLQKGEKDNIVDIEFARWWKGAGA